MNKKIIDENQINLVQKEIPEIVVVGISHKTAPLQIREKFSFSGEKSDRFLSMSRESGICEIVYLNTCNRVEIYFTTHEVNASVDIVLDLLEKFTLLKKSVWSNYIYKKFARDAVVHLLSVASSVDSMVIGENEIYGQLKQAYKHSVNNHSSNIILNRLFHQAFNTAKKVRTRTEISKNTVSVASIAAEQCKKMFKDFSNRSALLIGAGEIGKLILKYFTKFNIKHITISNRTSQHADEIAQEINRNADFIPLSEISPLPDTIDVLISTIHYDGYVVTRKMLERDRAGNPQAPLIIFDLAVPRNIDPDIEDLDNIFIYNIDDLKSIAEENRQNRSNAVEQALEIIYFDSEEFFNWYHSLEIIPVIKKIQKKFNSIRMQELDKYRLGKLKNLDEEDFNHVIELTRQIMSKTLHNPIMALKDMYSKDSCEYHDKQYIKKKTKMLEDLFNK